MPKASSIAHIWPISQCNVCPKTISRILNIMLSIPLSSFISAEQAGFIRGMDIHDNLMLAHDLVHDIHNLGGLGNMVIKLDLANAYDRISWSFILAIL